MEKHLFYNHFANGVFEGSLKLHSCVNASDAIGFSLDNVEENNYYPFGLKHKGYNNTPIPGQRDHKYGFGGKEEQNELGLEWHDYHSRNYDASLGRWMNVDPLAEKYYDTSSYTYVSNNPIRYTDPTGMSQEDIIVHGSNNVTYTIPTAGKKDYNIYLPNSLPGNGGVLDIGLKNVDPSNIAYGFHIGASAEASAVLGVKIGGGFSKMRFLNDDFANYDYYYTESYDGGSTGVQEGASANLEGSFIFAYYTGNDIPTPKSFEGSSTERSLSFDIKALAGLGVNIGGFTNDQLNGVILGGEFSIGEAVNLGSFSYGESNSTLLNNQIRTNEQSSADRMANATLGIFHAIYQYNNR